MKRALIGCVLLALLLLEQLSLEPHEVHAQDREPHEYRLSASLHPERHEVVGHASIRWTNESDQPQRVLFLHLYLNAFRDDESVFMRNSGSSLRGVRARGNGYIEISELLVDGVDQLASATSEGFPSARENDRTQLQVPLPRAVPPRGHVDLEIDFVSKLPPVFARSGYHEDFFMVAQWFPKVARLEPDGTWASFPYHAHGEFYADFARYELEVDVPRGWVVGASGVQEQERDIDGRVHRRFVIDRVHDVAFAAAPYFLERRSRFDALGDEHAVDVRCLFPPGYESAVDVHMRTTLAGLEHYGQSYGPYAHPVLTVIVPPRGAEGAAGMEYPTLFTTAGEWFAIDSLHSLYHEEVTAHELAHQWFQGMLGSNEVEHPMLDEGLTSWATQDFLRHLHGERSNGSEVFGIPLDGFEFARVIALRGKRTPPPGRPAHAFRGSSYGRSIYLHTSVVLESVARTWGHARFARAMKLYAQRHRFEHPVPHDLFMAFDHEYWPGFSDEVLRPALIDGALSAVRVHRLDDEEYVVERMGALSLPTHVELHHESGEVTRLPFTADDARLIDSVDHERGRVVGVVVDPDHHGLLDPNRTDDFARVDDSLFAGNAFFGRVLSAWQWFFASVGP